MIVLFCWFFNLCFTFWGSGCSDYQLHEREHGDLFYQSAAGKLDLLLVIDNSCSMKPQQEKLAAHFDDFLYFFQAAQLDYQLGVTSTTVAEPLDSEACLTQQPVHSPGQLVEGQVIRSTTPEPEQRFAELVQVGNCGSPNEMGMESARLLLDNVDVDFLRPDAYLSLLFVSDEQDVSPHTLSQYLQDFRQLQPAAPRDFFRASALVLTDLEQCATDELAEEASVGSRYIELSQRSGGVVGDLCSDDFSSIARDLSLNSTRLQERFFLRKIPDLTTLKVEVNGVLQPCDGTGEYPWRYELLEQAFPVVVFSRQHLPPPYAHIAVQYDAGNGREEDFCSN